MIYITGPSVFGIALLITTITAIPILVFGISAAYVWGSSRTKPRLRPITSYYSDVAYPFISSVAQPHRSELFTTRLFNESSRHIVPSNMSNINRPYFPNRSRRRRKRRRRLIKNDLQNSNFRRSFH